MTKTPVYASLLCAILVSTNAFAQMTDVVYLRNGDRITGSISEMTLGEMRFETRSMGWVSIKWEDVVGLETTKTIQFETAAGERIFGSIGLAQGGNVSVSAREGDRTVEMDDIVHFTRIKADRSVWEAMDKDLRVGFSYSRSSDIFRWNVGGGLSYKAENYRTSIQGSSLVTNDGQGDDTRRAELTGRFQRYLNNRYLWFANATAETNDALGIDNRFLVGLGAGRYVWQRRASELMLAAGLAGSIENSIGTQSVAGRRETKLEGLLDMDWTFFKLHTPSSRINTSLQYYPGITDSGRHRAILNVSFKQEFIKDFFWNLEFFGSYDSDPPPGAVAGEDYGVTTSLEYDW